MHLATDRLKPSHRAARRVPGAVLMVVVCGVPIAGCTRTALEVAASVPVSTVPVSTVAVSTVPVSTVPESTVAVSPTTVALVTTVPDVAACVAALPLEWRAGQVLMPAAYADSLGEVEALVDAVPIGGIVLMTWSAEADADRLRALRTRSSVPLLIATDEEGGTVQRLRSLGKIPSQRDVAAASTPAEAAALVADHAGAVAALGIDIVLGPVVDVGSAAPIGSRSFGDDPSAVAQYARAYVDAWRSVGITPTLKHFPGHGRASADTHERAASTPPFADLDAVEFVPYRTLAATPGIAVMVGHLDTDGLTEDGVPASLSPSAIGMLRSIGYDDAIVVTDALDMGAVPLDLPEAAVVAVAAGADIALFTGTGRTAAVHAAIVDAVQSGQLPAARLDDAVLRLLTRKGVDPCSM